VTDQPVDWTEVYTPCPFCLSHLRKGRTECSWCGVPLAAFEPVPVYRWTLGDLQKEIARLRAELER
jgi:hypothetical protein